MNKLALFEDYFMTYSTPDFLASVYGYGTSINEFSASLPDGADIVDIGAGLSTFGAAVATRRPDVRWTNFDFNYGRAHRSADYLTEVRDVAPENVTYVSGDILDPPAEMSGKFDRAFSYNLATHLIRADRSLGRTALQNMLQMLDSAGQLQVGPIRRSIKNANVHKVAELPAGAGLGEVDATVDVIATPRFANIYHNAVWESDVAIYAARRFDSSLSGYVLSDDGGQSYQRMLSVSGVLLAGKLFAGAVRAIV